MMIAETIQSQRKQAGWTQAQLADRLRVSVKTVANWEHGRTLPDIDNIMRLAGLWQLPLEALLGGDVVTQIKHQQQEAQWLRWFELAPTANNTVLLLLLAWPGAQVSVAYMWWLVAAITLNGLAMIVILARHWGQKKKWRDWDLIDWLGQLLPITYFLALAGFGFF